MIVREDAAGDVVVVLDWRWWVVCFAARWVSIPVEVLKRGVCRQQVSVCC